MLRAAPPTSAPQPPVPGRGAGTSARLIAYSPALDGLRGVSVVLVVAYHLGLSWAVGGFLGVDVFFVVSGYLITALLLAEQTATGTIDLRAFWTRRIRRLLPSVLLLVLAVLAAERLWPTFDRPSTLRGDALSVLGYFSNWRFVVTGSSYFDQYSAPSPFRHTWSLAIEEQWYLAWPLVVALLVRRRNGRRALAFATLALAAASAVAMLVCYVPGDDPSRAYYGTDTRAQALLVGAGLAIASSARARIRAGRAFRAVDHIATATALAAVLLITWAVTQKPSFDPWFYEGGATLVALGAAALVWACVRRAGPVARVLACRPLVQIGLRSYAIYLWHWPVIGYCNSARTGAHGTALLLLRIAITAALAEGSYRLVENPIRRSRVGAMRLLIGGAATVALLAFVLTPAPHRRSEVADAVAVRVTTAPEGSMIRGTNGLADFAPSAPRRVLVVGDSVAFRLMYHWPADPSLSLDPHGAAMIGCGLAGGSVLRGGHPVPPPNDCDEVDDLWREAIEQYDPDVVLAVYGPLEVQDRSVDGTTLRVGTDEYRMYLRQQLEHAIAVATQGGARFVLTDVPCFGSDDAIDSGIGEERDDPRRIAAVNEVFRSVAASDPDHVTMLPLSELLCPNGHDEEGIDGIPMRDDGVHFTPEGAVVTWRWLAARLPQ